MSLLVILMVLDPYMQDVATRPFEDIFLTLLCDTQCSNYDQFSQLYYLFELTTA